MFLYDSHTWFFHFFFQYMIFSLGIYFIKKFFFQLFKLFMVILFVWYLIFSFWKLFSEHCVIFLSQGFNGKSYLFSKIITRIFTVRPSNKLFNWNNILRSRLTFIWNCCCYRTASLYFQVNVCFWVFKNFFVFCIFNLCFCSVFLYFFLYSWTSS